MDILKNSSKVLLSPETIHELGKFRRIPLHYCKNSNSNSHLLSILVCQSLCQALYVHHLSKFLPLTGLCPHLDEEPWTYKSSGGNSVMPPTRTAETRPRVALPSATGRALSLTIDPVC